MRKEPSAPSSKKSCEPAEIAFCFDDLMGGLEDALAHAERKLALNTTNLPRRRK